MVRHWVSHWVIGSTNQYHRHWVPSVRHWVRLVRSMFIGHHWVWSIIGPSFNNLPSLSLTGLAVIVIRLLTVWLVIILSSTAFNPSLAGSVNQPSLGLGPSGPGLSWAGAWAWVPSGWVCPPGLSTHWPGSLLPSVWLAGSLGPSAWLFVILGHWLQ